jgi:sugar transferase (PEP-CTERM/EpsH1 system associated)
LPLESDSGVSESTSLPNPDLKTAPSNLRVLQFAPRVPWPLDTGAKLRNYHLARVLAEHFPMTLLAFGEQNSTGSDLQKVYERIVTVPRDERYSARKVLRGAIGSTPLPLLNYTTEEMKQALRALLNEQSFDLIQVESVHLMDYLPLIRSITQKSFVICDWHNVESELMKQYSEREQSFARRSYAGRTARLMKAAERRALDQFDAHVVVSAEDAERLCAVKSSARVVVIENGVDARYYSEIGDESTPRNRVVFVGSMDYHANIDAAIHFAQNAWPVVHKNNPDLIFTIVGRDPSPAVRQLSSIAGVEVTGSVADLRPYYREAVIAVVPLRVGGGSRLKILEAMAAGVPVVSTKLGAEGLQVMHGENILLAHDDSDLVDKIEVMIAGATLRSQIIANARALVTGRYEWSELGRALSRVYTDLIATAR